MDVIIDADFINMLTSVSSDPDLLVTMVGDLNVNPCVHTYVANEELFSNTKFKELLSNKVITEIKYEDFLKDELSKMLYESEFIKLYKAVNGPVNIPIDVFKDRRAKCNMGEIHSVLLAKAQNIAVFLSNDKGARAIANNYINTSIYTLDVKNIPIVLKEIATKQNKKTKWKSAKRLLKDLNVSENEIEEISSLWHS